MREIFGYIIKMVPSMLLTLPRIIIFRGSLYWSRRRKGLQTNFVHELGLAVFFLFIAGLASQTIMPDFVISAGGIRIISSGIGRVNLIPLHKLQEIKQIVFRDGYFSYFLIEVVGNVVMFAVIGFMLPLLWQTFEKVGHTIIACFLSSLFIEAVQLFLPRATDIDDLLMNTLGGIIGCLAYLLVKRMSPDTVSAFK